MDNTSKFSLIFEKEPDFLHVRVTGERIRKILFDIAVEIIETAVENQYTKVLVDISQLTGQLNTIDSYDLGTKDLPKLRQAIRMKIAIRDTRISENLQFFETVCRNIGLNIRVFTDTDEAGRWLRSDNYF
jgi:hypothetical protein